MRLDPLRGSGPLSARLAAPSAGAAPRREGGPGRDAGTGDRFDRTRTEPDASPLWLVKMATDRLAGRRYLSDAETRAGATLERAWLRELAAQAGSSLAGWEPGGLEAYGALAARLCAAAGPFEPPRVVSQPHLTCGRAQYLFRAEGGLVQLRLGAAGTPAEWVATVAHETFHHLQQELVTALYQGRSLGAPPLDALAAYYRDARAVYVPSGPHCPPARHREQALEVGAWAFGAAIAAVWAKGSLRLD